MVKVEPEFHSFACRWYAPPASCVTLLFAPPFWFVVQSVMPEGGGVDAGGGGGVVGGAWIVDVLGVGAGGEDGLDTGVVDALAVGVGEDATLGSRFGFAVGDVRDDADGLDREFGDDAEPEGELAGHPEVPLTDASASVPEAWQPSSMTWWLETTSAFSSAGIHALSIDAACGA
jgi:hypothetical protein